MKFCCYGRGYNIHDAVFGRRRIINLRETCVKQNFQVKKYKMFQKLILNQIWCEMFCFGMRCFVLECENTR